MTWLTLPPSIQVVKFLESDPEIRIDPMATIFPRVTKCSYYKYGPSGTVQTHDAICVLVSALSARLRESHSNHATYAR